MIVRRLPNQSYHSADSALSQRALQSAVLTGSLAARLPAARPSLGAQRARSCLSALLTHCGPALTGATLAKKAPLSLRSLDPVAAFSARLAFLGATKSWGSLLAAQHLEDYHAPHLHDEPFGLVVQKAHELVEDLLRLRLGLHFTCEGQPSDSSGYVSSLDKFPLQAITPFENQQTDADPMFHTRFAALHTKNELGHRLVLHGKTLPKAP